MESLLGHHWHHLPAEEVLDLLDTAGGLSMFPRFAVSGYSSRIPETIPLPDHHRPLLTDPWDHLIFVDIQDDPRERAFATRCLQAGRNGGGNPRTRFASVLAQHGPERTSRGRPRQHHTQCARQSLDGPPVKRIFARDATHAVRSKKLGLVWHWENILTLLRGTWRSFAPRRSKFYRVVSSSASAIIRA